MISMAGRPRKHPQGLDLVSLNLRLTPELKAELQNAAASRGMYITDYVGALVSNDLHKPIAGVPPLQEVIDLKSA